METVFRSQSSIKFSELLKTSIMTSKELLIASAYLTADGLKQLELPNTKRITKIICGVHGCVSDLHLLHKIVNSHGDCFQANVFIGSNVFHPKLYFFIDDIKVTLFCGSANCTGQGLAQNEEALIEIKGSKSDSPLAKAIDYFNFLWSQSSVPVSEYLKAHPDYTKCDISTFTHQQLNILQNLRQELEPFDNDCEDQIGRSLRQRHYSKYMFEIFLKKPKGEWFSGHEICEQFTKGCSSSEVLDTNGNVCKGFNYNYLFNEVIGCSRGELIECPTEVLTEHSKYPAYKQMNFRIKVSCYGAVQKALNNHVKQN